MYRYKPQHNNGLATTFATPVITCTSTYFDDRKLFVWKTGHKLPRLFCVQFMFSFQLCTQKFVCSAYVVSHLHTEVPVSSLCSVSHLHTGVPVSSLFSLSHLHTEVPVSSLCCFPLARRCPCVQFMFCIPLAHRRFSHCPFCCSVIYRSAHSYQQDGSFVLTVRNVVVIAADCKMELYCVTIEV